MEHCIIADIHTHTRTHTHAHTHTHTHAHTHTHTQQDDVSKQEVELLEEEKVQSCVEAYLVCVCSLLELCVDVPGAMLPC